MSARCASTTASRPADTRQYLRPERVPVTSAETERELVGRALTRGLLLDCLARHHVGWARWFGIALGYAACSREELRTALPVLVEPGVSDH